MRRLRCCRVGHGFTLVELMVVVAFVAIVAALGVASLNDAIAEARYRADRARLYLSIAEARDTAADRKIGVFFEKSGDHAIVVRTRLVDSCGGAGAPTPLKTLEFPALTISGAVGPLDLIFSSRGACETGAAIGFTSNDGVAGGTIAGVTQDSGRIADSWGEFGSEGALNASACDVDKDPNCGK